MAESSNKRNAVKFEKKLIKVDKGQILEHKKKMLLKINLK